MNNRNFPKNTSLPIIGSNESALDKTKYFIAMEYYGLILNRTFLIVYGTNYLIGIKVNGLVSADNPSAPLGSLIVSPIVIKGDLDDPLSYVKRVDALKNIDLENEELLIKHNSDFHLSYKEILDVRYDPKKKWGMGYYPHDGKVYVITNTKKREFIILGNQSGKKIADAILQRTFL